MKRYDVIIFDLDGTLSNSKEGITKCVQYALEKQGIIEENLDALVHFIGPPLEDELIRAYNLSKEAAKQGVADYRSRYVPIGIYETEAFPNTEKMLKKLKEHGKTIALATSKPQAMAEEVLRYLQIDSYFDYIKGADLHGTIQTKKAVLNALFDRINVDKSSCLMVGDTSFDINGANEVGIASVGVSFGFGDVEDMKNRGALTIVNSMEELTEILTR